MERRRGVRFEIQLTCRLKRLGATEMVDATTLNLGRMGALIRTVAPPADDTKAMPQAGETVQLEVLLPANRQFGQRCLACQAIALRSATEDGKSVIALQFHRLQVRNVISRFEGVLPLAVM